MNLCHGPRVVKMIQLLALASFAPSCSMFLRRNSQLRISLFLSISSLYFSLPFPTCLRSSRSLSLSPSSRTCCPIHISAVIFLMNLASPNGNRSRWRSRLSLQIERLANGKPLSASINHESLILFSSRARYSAEIVDR